MNWQTLFDMQKELDNYILAQHDLKNENVFEKKGVSFAGRSGRVSK